MPVAKAELPNPGPLIRGHRVELPADLVAGSLPVKHHGAAARVIKRILHGSQIELVEVGAELDLPGRHAVETGAPVLQVLPAELVDHAVVAVIAGVELVKCAAQAVLRRGIAGSVVVLHADPRLEGGIDGRPAGYMRLGR